MAINEVFTDALSWEELIKMEPEDSDLINGPTNSYTKLRLFGKPEKTIRVTLYRDHHAWCPYCQKIWLWLEWKKIPYRIKKVTMRCYGRKETWYLQKVPSGMLPALEIDNHLITESDEILLALEKIYGPMGAPLSDTKSLRLRNLERQLFRAWCIWLCQPRMNQNEELKAKENFQIQARIFEEALNASSNTFLDGALDEKKFSIPGSADIVFIPYLERMNASLAYYKGFQLREEHPSINNWLIALENQDTYRGTQGDFHTHAHDLPPQMGGCWTDESQEQKRLSMFIDSGQGLGELETSFVTNNNLTEFNPALTALKRVLKHREKIKELNPLGSIRFDQPLRAALTSMVLKKNCLPDHKSAFALRYLRDRISVPRDMPLLAARELRQALEKTAQNDNACSTPLILIPTKHRYDQNPEPFLKAIK